MGCTVVIGTVASFWVTSYHVQTEILSDIRRRIQDMPSGATLILDGICPYHGIAPIFESAWDLSGALRILYGDPNIQANVAGRGVAVKEHGLVIAPAGDSTSYPYDQLYVYHFGRKETYTLSDAETAQSYFNAISPERGGECSADAYGNGVDVMNGLVSTLKTRFRGVIGAK